jgi:hypothetical protein
MVPIVGCWQETPQTARSRVASIRSSLQSLHEVVVLGAWPMICLQDRLVDREGSLELQLTHRDRRLLNLNSKASMCFRRIFCASGGPVKPKLVVLSCVDCRERAPSYIWSLRHHVLLQQKKRARMSH